MRPVFQAPTPRFVRSRSMLENTTTGLENSGTKVDAQIENSGQDRGGVAQ
jgi:hypothetical protein